MKNIAAALVDRPVFRLESVALVAAVAVAATLGVWARFSALGASSLAVDEHYLLASAYNVLAHGLPQFDCGGYYTRGLLHQYSTAALLFVGVAPETAIRLPAALAELIAIAGAGLLARHLGGRWVAVFVVVLLLFSLWQVEFARFGRMYAAFQACTMFYVLAAVKYFESGERRHFRWMLVLGAGTALVHEGGALLAAFTALALLLAPARRSLLDIGLALAALAASVALVLVDFRYLGAQAPYATDLLEEIAAYAISSSLFRLPALPPLFLLAVLAITAAVTAVAAGWRFQLTHASEDGRSALLAAAAWVLVALAMVNGLFLLAAVLLAAAILFRLIDVRAYLNRRSLAALAGGAAIIVVAWTLHALLTPEFGVRELAHRALRFPDFFRKVWVPWRGVLPDLGAAILVVSVAAGAIVALLREPSAQERRYRLLLAVTLTLFTAAVLSPQPYYETRYIYFLYPLFLILLIQGALIAMRHLLPRVPPAAALLPVAVLFVFSNDFSLRHLLNAADPQYMYRLAYGTALTNHFYPRWDYRGVGEYLDANAAEEDLVLTAAYPGMPFYSRLFDAVYVDRADPRLRIVSACQGQRDIWTNLPLISDPARLRATIEHAGRPVWLVLRSERYASRQLIEAQLHARFATNEVYRSIDGNLALVRIP